MTYGNIRLATEQWIYGITFVYQQNSGFMELLVWMCSQKFIR